MRSIASSLASAGTVLALATFAPVSAMAKGSPAKAAAPAAAAPAAQGAPEKLVLKRQGADKLSFLALRYQSELQAVGELRVNGVRLATFDGKGASGSSREVQQWLFPGTNRVELATTKVPETDEYSFPPFRVSLHGLASPGFPDDSNALWKIELKKGPGAPGVKTYTFELAPGDAPTSDLPQKAAVLGTVSDADKREITALAQAMLTAVQKSDTATLSKLWAFRFSEIAKMNGVSPAQVQQGLTEQVAHTAKTFAKAKLPANPDFVLVAGGRVVQVTDNGGPAIHVGGADEGAALDVYVAKIDGAWTFAR